jgi:hypothetical protein
MSLDITQAREYLSITVGGYLYGTRRGAGFCRVCTAPVEDPFLDCKACYDITDQAVTSSAPLADLVVPLVYIGDEPQSKLLMHGYKGDQIGSVPQEDLLLSVLLMAGLGLLIHRRCIESAVSPLTALSFVPSTRARPDHPIQRIVTFMSVEAQLPIIESAYIGPEPSLRRYFPADYKIKSGYADPRHVLLIDDTWTTGGSAQSVATSLKLVGSESVTVLVVGRWLRNTWRPSANFIAEQMKQKPYTPFDCPVSGVGPCP